MLKMDDTTLPGIMYSAGSILAAVGVLFMNAPPRPAGPGMMSFVKSAPGLGYMTQMIGVSIPFILMGLPVLVDMGFRKFKYSIVTLIGVIAMGVGIAVQRAIVGNIGQLTMLTVGTSAMIGYLFQDAIVEPMDMGVRVTYCLFMLAALILQVLNSAIGGFSPLISDLSAVALGTGLGVTSWLIVWTYAKDKLPYFVATTPSK